MDREEFYRLKKVWTNTLPCWHCLIKNQVANKKQRDTAAADAEMASKREKADVTASRDLQDVVGGADILGEQDDADIIF